jgi:hypothetical protein
VGCVLLPSGLRLLFELHLHSAFRQSPAGNSRSCRPGFPNGDNHPQRDNSAALHGLSYEKSAMTYSYFHESNQHLIGLFRRLGDGVLRIGGGSVDHVMWTPDSTGTHLQVTPVEIKALAGFLQATGWLCLYGVNLATSTPALAAEEVAYAASVLGPNLLGIEIGNEPDEYGAAGNFFAGNWTLEDFLARWNMFRSAILQSAAPGSHHRPSGGWGEPYPHLDLAFRPGNYGGRDHIADPALLSSQRVQPDGHRRLPHQPRSPTRRLPGSAQPGGEQLGIPYRITECNSFYNGGAVGVSNSYASSLWVIDFFLMWL